MAMIKWCHKHKLLIGFIALILASVVSVSGLYYLNPESLATLFCLYILVVWVYSGIKNLIIWIGRPYGKQGVK